MVRYPPFAIAGLCSIVADESIVAGGCTLCSLSQCAVAPPLRDSWTSWAIGYS
jgi:hypothetical protein